MSPRIPQGASARISGALRRAAALGRGAAVGIAACLALPATSLGASSLQPPNPPQNPYMAANPFNNIHNDTWMTDAYQIAGPTGKSLKTGFGAYSASLCGSLTFDKRGRILSVCPSSGAAPQVRMFDPKTLKILATYDLPTAPDAPGTQLYQNFTG